MIAKRLSRVADVAPRLPFTSTLLARQSFVIECGAAVMERYSVWKSSGEDIAVCDAQQCCVVFRRNFEEQISDFCGGDRIEISRRFISQQQRRLMNQSATHGNPLPLPA